jgi:hypothetical protein
MSVHHISMVLSRSEPTKPVSRLVLLVLANYAIEAGISWPSVKTIARLSGASRRAVQYAIREMEASGLIYIRKGGRTADHRNERSNHYWLVWDRAYHKPPPEGATTAPLWAQSTTPEGANTAPPRAQSTTSEGATTAQDTLETHQRTQKGHTMSSPDSISDEDIYIAYPKHVGKADALKAIRKVLSQSMEPAELLEHVQHYAAAVAAWPASDHPFVPYPASWFNAGRYLDDPKEWRRSSVSAFSGSAKNSSVEPVAHFDPDKPHAHTGGVEVVA